MYNSIFFSDPLFFLPLYCNCSHRGSVAAYDFHRQCDHKWMFKVNLVEISPVFSDHQSFFGKQVMYWEFCSAGLICVDRIDTDKANAFFNQIFCNFSIYIRMVEKFVCSSCFIPVCMEENDFSVGDFVFIFFNIF